MTHEELNEILSRPGVDYSQLLPGDYVWTWVSETELFEEAQFVDVVEFDGKSRVVVYVYGEIRFAVNDKCFIENPMKPVTITENDIAVWKGTRNFTILGYTKNS